MIPKANQFEYNKLYIRLVALWILIESFLGGIIHGLKIPVSGLLVGGSAMICIILIAHYFPSKGSVMKAMLLVAIFKMMLSPHSPAPAYLAVFFQGILGEFLLKRKSIFAIACILFGIITMLESALQRILVLIFLYGSEFWKAVDIWLAKTTGFEEFNQFSILLAMAYLITHFLVGGFLGWFGWRLTRMNFATESHNLRITIPELQLLQKEVLIKNKSHRRNRFLLFIFWFFAIFLFVQAWFQPDSAILPPNKIFELLLRFFVIVSSYILIIQPLVHRILRKWLKSKKSELANQINEIQQVMPEVKFLVKESWKKSGAKISNFRSFLSILFFNLFLIKDA